MLGPHLTDELLHLPLRTGIEPRRRLVEQQQDRARQQGPGEGDLLLHPAGEVLHRLPAAIFRKADTLQDPWNLLTRIACGHPVEPGRVAKVLGGRHLLEEARLHRDAVDEPLHGALFGEDVMAEHPGAATVVQQQRRQQADQRRLARAVLAQDRDALTAAHREADVPQGGHRAVVAAERAFESALVLAAATATELLAEVAHLDGRNE